MDVLKQIDVMDNSYPSKGLIRDHFPTCASRVFMKPVNLVNKVGVHGVVGDLKTYPNKYEPPSLEFDFDALLDIADAIVDGDGSKLYDNVKKVLDEPMCFKKKIETTTKVSQSEKNVEYTFFNDVSIVDLARRAHCSKLVFVNPSKGTLYRYVKSKDSNFSVYLTNDVDDQYERVIRDISGELGIDYVRRGPFIESPNTFYYLSFSGHLGHKLGMSHYLGWEPNPASLGHSGLITEMIENIDSYLIKYNRGYVKEFVYPKRAPSGYIIYPVDFLYETYSQSSYFSNLQWFCHDMHTSERIYTRGISVKRSTLIPYDCLYLVGDYFSDHQGILDVQGNYVFRYGNQSVSSRTLHPAWRTARVDENILLKASYMISRYGATPIFLGNKRSVSIYSGLQVDREDLVRIGDSLYVNDPRGNYTLRQLDVDWEVHEEPCINLTLSDIVGSTYYCNSTYQTIVGVKYKFVGNKYFQTD